MSSPKFVSGTWITITNPSCTYDALSDYHHRHYTTEHGKWRRGGGENKITRAPHLVRATHVLCGPTSQPERTNKREGREGGRGSLASTTAGVVKDPPPLPSMSFLGAFSSSSSSSSWLSRLPLFGSFVRSKGNSVYLLARHSVPTPHPQGEGFG